MRITTWTEYSLIISLHLAKRGRREAAPVAARELAETERLPADYVEQILLRLRRAGIVESVRGARGGYLLAKAPEAISVRDVMAASEHQTFEMNCESHPVDVDRCAPGSSCAIRHVWQALQLRIDGFLGGITLADLLKDEAPSPELVPLSSGPVTA
jgi:Rrf2 family transcriptional regulator, iron-sulfur cluster assembly transcription factor